MASTDIFHLSDRINDLETVLAAVPLMGLIGSSRAREKWTLSCASGSGALLLPMASYSDCQALLQPLKGDPHVAAHINMGSKFDVSQRAAVASMLQEVRGMAVAGVVEPRTPHGRRQKLYVAEIEHQEAQVKGRVITGLQVLVMVIICIVGSVRASPRSVIYLWTYVIAAFVTTCAAISCYPDIPKTLPARSRTKAYVVTPNWNSDELFMLIGDGDELAAILNRPARQGHLGRAATVSVSISCFFVAVASALLLGQPELRTHLSMLLLVSVGWFDWCPLRYRRRRCRRSIEHTLDRRRTAYTAIQVLHGRSESPGWWSDGLPNTPRSHHWAEAVETACKGKLTLATTIDDFGDLVSARDVVRVTIKEGFSPMPDAWAGVENFMKAS
ncbi:hypothetical protein EDD21DRAFT_364071 [Dissophora ornata]|nr:hypothetical protein EDD21DRAFT_364071 [Dissophora ornata]